MSFKLGTFLSRTVKFCPSEAESIVNKILKLPNDSLLKILTSPETVCRLNNGLSFPDALTFLSDSVDAEYSLLGIDCVRPRGIWSCLGEAYFPASHDLTQNNLDEQKSNQVYLAPRLVTGIPVDFCSIFARNELPGITDRYIDLSVDEERLIKTKLDASIKRIMKIDKNVIEIMNYFTKSVLVRKQKESSFSSGSSRDYIGRIVLTNPHHSKIKPVDLAESLIHETIHSFLYVMEIKSPFILDRSIESTYYVYSPWTGTKLALHSYLHACLVWFGLLRFWKLAYNKGIFTKNEINPRMLKSYSGFIKDSLLKPISNVSHVISSDLLVVINDLQDIVECSRY